MKINRRTFTQLTALLPLFGLMGCAKNITAANSPEEHSHDAESAPVIPETTGETMNVIYLFDMDRQFYRAWDHDNRRILLNCGLNHAKETLRLPDSFQWKIGKKGRIDSTGHYVRDIVFENYDTDTVRIRLYGSVSKEFVEQILRDNMYYYNDFLFETNRGVRSWKEHYHVLAFVPLRSNYANGHHINTFYQRTLPSYNPHIPDWKQLNANAKLVDVKYV